MGASLPGAVGKTDVLKIILPKPETPATLISRLISDPLRSATKQRRSSREHGGEGVFWIQPQAFEKSRFVEEKNLDFASLRFDFSFPKIWIFLPAALETLP
jgi:hypothetical protein